MPLVSNWTHGIIQATQEQKIMHQPIQNMVEMHGEQVPLVHSTHQITLVR